MLDIILLVHAHVPVRQMLDVLSINTIILRVTLLSPSPCSQMRSC